LFQWPFSFEELAAIQEHMRELFDFLINYLQYPMYDEEMKDIAFEEGLFISWLSSDLQPSRFFPHEATL
jgi:hypothetical protein